MAAMVKSEGDLSGRMRHAREIIIANVFCTKTSFEGWCKLTSHRLVTQFCACSASIASQR